MDLTGKHALVTGGAQGIGAATVRRLAAAGAAVTIADVDRAQGEALAAELGGAHRFAALDVTDDAAWAALAAEIEAVSGGLDVVFLNAGVIARPDRAMFGGSGLDWLNAATMRKLFGVNLFGVTLGLAHCFPLTRAKGGTIVATGSTAGINIFELDPIYSASKAGVIALVKGLAREFAEAGVRLCAVNPGSVDTRIYPSNYREERLAAGTLAQPDYLAGAVMAILDHGRPGELWMARPEDRGYWVYEPRQLPIAANGEEVPADARFVEALADDLPVAA